MIYSIDLFVLLAAAWLPHSLIRPCLLKHSAEHLSKIFTGLISRALNPILISNIENKNRSVGLQ
jgi:hypothetical protein